VVAYDTNGEGIDVGVGSSNLYRKDEIVGVETYTNQARTNHDNHVCS
jgi:hypothetical protein